MCASWINIFTHVYLLIESNIKWACLNLSFWGGGLHVKSLHIRPQALWTIRIRLVLVLACLCECALQTARAHTQISLFPVTDYVSLGPSIFPGTEYVSTSVQYTQVSLFPGTEYAGACLHAIALLVQMNGATQAVGANFSNYLTCPKRIYHNANYLKIPQLRNTESQ